VTALWRGYAGAHGVVLGIDSFGASGKAPDLYRKFGITAEHVTRGILALVA
jgi:transketolase